MADSISPSVRQIVGKLHVSATPEEAVSYFWSRVKNKGEDMPDSEREKFERQVRKCHQENQKEAGRAALGFMD
jgi:hypothetical protein